MTFIKSWWGWATIAGAFFGLILGCAALWDVNAALMQIAASGVFGACILGELFSPVPSSTGARGISTSSYEPVQPKRGP